MLKSIFENESFEIFSLHQEIQLIAYLIIPKYLNLPVFNLCYFKKIHKILSEIGAYQISEEELSKINQSIKEYKIQYVLPLIDWKNLKNALFYKGNKMEIIRMNLQKVEIKNKKNLFSLLKKINNDTLCGGPYA